MADDKTPPTAADIEGATPDAQPANVVTDNSGQVPVQPVASSDPTINDNTNPKVPFDGSDPRNIPPHDSNEQLHIAADKRARSESEGLGTAADVRRAAVEAAYDNSKDVRDVLGENNGDGEDPAAARRAKAQAGNRAQPPANRTSKPNPSTTKA